MSAVIVRPRRARGRRIARAVLAWVALALAGSRADAQIRERPIPFDSAGRLSVITPPLAARLGLAAPVWPVTGDFVEARLYEVEEAAATYVLVVRRQREVLERFAIDAARRAELASAIARGALLARATDPADSMPTFISEPVRGQFVASQTTLGALLFGPAAATLVNDAAGGTAAYLLVAGGTFFYAANLTRTTPVSRAQNHLSSHSAVRGAIAGNLALIALAGDVNDERAVAAATLVGGVLGDIVGFQLAKPMTDAEAHGTAHGSTVSAVVAAGALGAFGAYRNEGSGRAAAAAVISAGALGYPLGLRYVRGAPYRVTAGDVGAMFTAELLGLGAGASLIPSDADDNLAFGLLTAGYGLGVLAGDRFFVRKYDHTESDARLLSLGTGAGAVMGLAVPVLAQSDDVQAIFASATIGGILGALVTESLIDPERATDRRSEAGRRTGSRGNGSRENGARVDVRFSGVGAVLAGSGVRGRHSVVSLTF